MSKPNILLIMIDQHRFDRPSCMGFPVFRTPNMAICGKLHYVLREQPFGFDYKPVEDTPYSSYANDDRCSQDRNEAAFKTDNWRTL